MEISFRMLMVHPIFEVLFPKEDRTIDLFEWICNKTKEPQKLEEFIRWHIEINQEVINEVSITQKIDLQDKKDATKWASEFLKNYDEKIRHMRNTSNLVFQRFQEINEKIKEGKTSAHPEINDLMRIFRNQNGLLIGKLIFAYRETWFVARKIDQPHFKIGSVSEYQDWVKENIENLKELKKSLKNIQENISRWKE